MKKLLCALLAAILSAAVLFGGCVSGVDGRDGQDLNIYDIYEATNAARAEKGQQPLEFLEFLGEYLSEINVSYSDDSNTRALINRSLLSSVAIVSEFSYSTSTVSEKSAFFSGSGIIVDMDKEAGDAYIVTDCHVVYDDVTNGKSSGISNDKIYNPQYAKNVFIYPYGSDDDFGVAGARAEIVGSAVSYDLALLKLTSSNTVKNSELSAVEFSADEQLYAGSPVYVVGNPEACGLSATRGIISRDSERLDLSIIEGGEKHEYRVLRTDAPVNGGNSGGGIFDSSGKAIGVINSKLIGDDIDNMGYALPAATVKRLWKLFADGYGSNGPRLKRAVFPLENLEWESSAYYDNDQNVTKIRDKVVVSTSYNGLAAGDVILGVRILSGQTVKDEITVERYYNVNDILLSAREGDTVEYSVLRRGERTVVTDTPQFSVCD